MYFFRLINILCLILCSLNIQAEELLRAQVNLDQTESVFSLSGESRENVVGGTLQFAEQAFTITHVSRLGTIGARRDSPNADENSAEFAIFSSSFSEQTATGQPWVKSQRYLGCDQAYNSFLAIYRVEGDEAIKRLSETPYGSLTDKLDNSTESTVYCFISRPPA